MQNIRFLKILLPVCWLVISLYYMMYCRREMVPVKSMQRVMLEQRALLNYRNRSERHIRISKDFLIDTPGCTIPNYMKTLRYKEAEFIKRSTCGQRAIFVTKINNDKILFTIDKGKMRLYTKEKYSCCYKYVGPSIFGDEIDFRSLRYTSCKNFTNNDVAELTREILTVQCVTHKNHMVYEDAYAVLKKINNTLSTDKGKNTTGRKSWNVLVLGMDTMSRGRAYSSMPKTVKYLLKNDWLDFRGYQKVGYNTFPNVVTLLTGKNVSSVYEACASGMDKCNEDLIWSQFKKAGYVTGSGEEYVTLPDTFSRLGYKSPPTDHYLRPLYLTGEHVVGNIVCTKRMPSAVHMLNYANTFAETYKREKFFGVFWFNSYSHNLNNIPTLIDGETVEFFTRLNDEEISNDTFIFLLSDHGIRTDKMRIPYESYYEERLPMFFMWVPKKFRDEYEMEYEDMKYNQYKLITPYDVYLTMRDILAKSTDDTAPVKAEGCPGCQSVFNEMSEYRTCQDGGVDEKWCTCHEMADANNSTDAKAALELAIGHLQEVMKDIKTLACMKCEILQLKKVFRQHTYRDDSSNSTYYVLAFAMTPGDVAYEATLVKRNDTLRLMNPTYTISVYNTRGSCVVNPNDRAYCVCKKIPKCTKND